MYRLSPASPTQEFSGSGYTKVESNGYLNRSTYSFPPTLLKLILNPRVNVGNPPDFHSCGESGRLWKSVLSNPQVDARL